MQQDDPWLLQSVNPPSNAQPKAEPQPPATIAEALLALDRAPGGVFAVLDGAQFDNLPQDLLLGDFVSRPLYLDRGDNNPEQVVTAPQMVWLDERSENPAGRAAAQTIPVLLALIAGRPAAVFWQCPAGADALYRHLRGLNMVYLPPAALPEADRRSSGGDDQPALFRHADANVMAQLIPSAVAQDLARLFGPARALFAPADPVWSHGPGFQVVHRPVDLPRAKEGMWHVSPATMLEMERYREACLRRKAVVDFVGNPAATDVSHARQRQVLATFDRALSYGLEEMKDIWDLISLDLKYGHGFERLPQFADALGELTNTDQAPAHRIHYARLACENGGVV